MSLRISWSWSMGFLAPQSSCMDHIMNSTASRYYWYCRSGFAFAERCYSSRALLGFGSPTPPATASVASPSSAGPSGPWSLARYHAIAIEHSCWAQPAPRSPIQVLHLVLGSLVRLASASESPAAPWVRSRTLLWALLCLWQWPTSRPCGTSVAWWARGPWLWPESCRHYSGNYTKSPSTSQRSTWSALTADSTCYRWTSILASLDNLNVSNPGYYY